MAAMQGQKVVTSSEADEWKAVSRNVVQCEWTNRKDIATRVVAKEDDTALSNVWWKLRRGAGSLNAVSS